MNALKYSGEQPELPRPEVTDDEVAQRKTQATIRRRLRHRLARSPLWVLAFLAVVAGLRLAMPYILKGYVNRELSKLPEYRGQVRDIDLSLWRGAYRIKDIQVFKITTNFSKPFFSAPLVDLSVEWRELFHGAVVGEIALDKPELNFTVGPTEASTQNGKNTPWTQTIERLFPVKINRAEIREGQVHFQNPHRNPPVDIYLKNLTATATNLTNTRQTGEKLPSAVKATGSALGNGIFDMSVRLDPLAPSPTFELNASLTNVDLTSLNDFLRAYGKFDVEHGTFALFTSAAAKDGHYDGYFKVFFENLNVFEWEKERKKSALGIFWEAIVGTVSAVFKNHPNDSLATTIPISGDYQKTDVGVWPAIGTLLENAFIHALVPKLDKEVKLEEVKVKK
ncbi:MAG TPA: DUF748 domain-containing protein [Candidatus Limnocylindria bacterium]|nr:DUF748 domain-containing protein [Candidatus Limnocylindria bacterium]